MDNGSGHLRLGRASDHGHSFHRRHAHNYYVMGCRHAEDGTHDDARRLFLRALDFDPNYVPALRALCTIELSAENIATAKQLAEHAVALAPTDSEVLALLGNIALSEHNHRAALDAFLAAQRAGGDTPELLFNTGLAHLLLGESGEASAIFKQLIEVQPTNHRVWDALGCALRMQKEYAPAIEAFLQALQIAPTFNDVRDHMAQLLLEAGDPNRARQVLESALSLEPNRPVTRQLLGMSYAAAQKYLQAAECWEGMLRDDCATAETYHLLANVYLHLNHDEKAQQVLEALIERFPDHLSGHLQLALILFEQGRHTEGQTALEKACALDPKNPAILQAIHTAQALYGITILT